MAIDDEKRALYSAVPLGTNALKRLGQSLAAERKLTTDEATLWGRFTADALDRTTSCAAAVRELLTAEPVAVVMPRVAESQFTGRPKTRRTLAEKLRRTPQQRLPAIHDVAGVRVVGRFSLFEQRQVVRLIRHHFDSSFRTSRPAELVDRLDPPMFGYRAMHVLVWPEGRPVEIQIRTELQHAWAQLMEVIADRWGREPRYGDPINFAEDQERDRRQSIIDELIRISSSIAEFEAVEGAAGIAHVHLPKPALVAAGVDPDEFARRQRDALESAPQLGAVKESLLTALAQFGVDADLGREQ